MTYTFLMENDPSVKILDGGHNMGHFVVFLVIFKYLRLSIGFYKKYYGTSPALDPLDLNQ